MGPYLILALAGWALGNQRYLDSPIVLVHCQDLKKVPQLSGVVLWLEAPRPTCASAVPMLGASTMGRTFQEFPSVDVLPPEEGAVLADVISVGSVGSAISVDVTSFFFGVMPSYRPPSLFFLWMFRVHYIHSLCIRWILALYGL